MNLPTVLQDEAGGPKFHLYGVEGVPIPVSPRGMELDEEEGAAAGVEGVWDTWGVTGEYKVAVAVAEEQKTFEGVFGSAAGLIPSLMCFTRDVLKGISVLSTLLQEN